MNSPVREKKIYCPSCSKQTTITFLPPLSSRLYSPKNKEEDQYVTAWEWQNPLWQEINPYYYSLWFCPLCSYIDFEEDFIKDKTNPSNKVFALKNLLEEDKNKQDSVALFLTNNIDYSQLDFKGAVTTFLLAIYIQELIPEVDAVDAEVKYTRDWRKLGRLYLRLSWLFRGKEQNLSAAGSDFVSDVFTEIGSLKKSLSVSLGNFKQVFNALIRLKKEQEKNGFFDKDLFLQVATLMEKIKGGLVTADSDITDLQIALKSSGEETSSWQSEDKELINCRDFLLQLTKYWPSVVTTEREALDQSIHYFELAAENDTHLTSVASYKMLELVAILYKKIGKPEEAINCLKIIVKKASEHRAKLFKKRSKSASLVEKLNVEDEIAKLNPYIQEMSYKAKIKQV